MVDMPENYTKPNLIGSNISSIESEVNTRIGRAWTATHRLSIIWKSDLCHEIKRVSSTLYLCPYYSMDVPPGR